MKAAVRFCFAVLIATSLAGCDRAPAAPTRAATPEPASPRAPLRRLLGLVVAADNRPVAGAAVTVSLDGSAVAATITDGTGAYLLEFRRADPFVTARVERDGFEVSNLALDLSGAEVKP